MPIYHLSKISIAGLYGRTDFDIDFENQQRISFLLGPNGSGKSTILKIIKSFLDSRLIPHSGTPVDGFSKKKNLFSSGQFMRNYPFRLRARASAIKRHILNLFWLCIPPALLIVSLSVVAALFPMFFRLITVMRPRPFLYALLGKGLPVLQFPNTSILQVL